MGGMGNAVVNTIVKMFTRRALGEAMRSAKNSTDAGKGKRVGGRKGRPKKRGAKNEKDNE